MVLCHLPRLHTLYTRAHRQELRAGFRRFGGVLLRPCDLQAAVYRAICETIAHNACETMQLATGAAHQLTFTRGELCEAVEVRWEGGRWDELGGRREVGGVAALVCEGPLAS